MVPKSVRDSARPATAHSDSESLRVPGIRRRMVALPFCSASLRAPRPVPRGYPVNPRSLGEHLRRRRLDAGLTQRAVAKRLGVDAWTVVNWEQDRTRPQASKVGALYRFLGYVPGPVPVDLPARIRAARRKLGLSQAGLALQLGVNPSTVQKWERGRRRPYRRFLRLFEGLVEQSGLLKSLPSGESTGGGRPPMPSRS
jgi:transcriptional regulator with XRE-family HTH domain